MSNNDFTFDKASFAHLRAQGFTQMTYGEYGIWNQKRIQEENIKKTMPINLSDFLHDEESFEWFRQCGAFEMDYNEFRSWNLDCIAALTEEGCKWTTELCRRIRDNKISLMDEESCSLFNARHIYFDSARNLCITNPR